MQESNDLKPGDSWNYQVGDKFLTVEPIPYGQLKKLMRIVFGVLDKIGKMESKEVMSKLPEIFEDNLGELIALMFKKTTHPFLTVEWVDENVSLVDMQKIVEKAIIVNGLTDFLEKMGLANKPVPVLKLAEAQETSATETKTKS